MALTFTYDTHVQDNTTGTTVVLTTGIAYPLGCRIIVGSNALSNRQMSSVVDSRGNVYAVDGVAGAGSSSIGSAPCTVPLQVGDTITVTLTGSSTGHAMWAGYIQGQAVNPADQTHGASASSTSPATSGNTPTTTQADEILIGTAGVAGVAAVEDAAFTNADNFTFAAAAVTQVVGTRLVAATGAYAYAPTFNGTHGWSSVIVTYKGLLPFSPPEEPNPTTGRGNGWKTLGYEAAVRSEGEVFSNRLLDLLASKDVFFDGAGKAPNYDWPNPNVGKWRGWKTSGYEAAVRSEGEVWENRLLNLLLSKDVFFDGAGKAPNYDWQLPTPRRDPAATAASRAESDVWSNRLLDLLASKDVFFNGAGKAPNYDWPNPTLRRPDLRYWAVAQPLTLQASFVARPLYLTRIPPRDYTMARYSQDGVTGMPLTLQPVITPFSQVDWPNPRGYTFAIEDRTFVDASEFWMLQDQFFGLAGNPNFDWPNPTPRRDPSGVAVRAEGEVFKDRLTDLLVGKDGFFGLAGNPNFDWPVPKGYIYPSSLRLFDQVLKLNLLGQDQFFGLAGNPNFDWPNPRGYPFPSDLRTYLQTIDLNLIGQDALPFNLEDWPVPLGHRVPLFPVSNRTWLDALKLNLIGQDKLPFALSDWPNPIPPRGVVTNRSWLDAVKLNLLGQDALPFRLSDWVNPSIARWPLDGRTLLNNLVETTLSAIVASPFSLTDWPNPRGAIFPVTDRTWTDALKLTLLGQDALPFNLEDWPNPLPPRSYIANRTWLDPLKLELAGQDKLPFAPSDWPLPLPARSYIANRSHLDALKLNLAGQDALPFNLADWPVPFPPRSYIANRTWLDPLKLNLQGKDFLPFALSDWPVPKGYPFPIADRTWLDVLKLELAGQDALPFRLSDWPLPIPARWPVDGRTFLLSNLLENTLALIIPFPFSLIDWPNPRIGFWPIANRTWLDPLKLELAGQDKLPFSQGDWPNPLGRAFPLEDRSYIDASEFWMLRDGFFGLAGNPTFDWPNPRGYPFPVGGRSHAATLLPVLLGQDKLPFALRDWPNPRLVPLVVENRTYVDASEFWMLVDQFFGLAGNPTFDWPNPRGYPFPLEGRTAIATLLPELVGQDKLPFALRDWPNPRAPLRPQELAALNLLVGSLGAFPFFLTDWPNPRGRAFPIELRTYLASLLPELVGRDQFFGLAGNPTFDWPVPWPARRFRRDLLGFTVGLFPGLIIVPPIGSTPRKIYETTPDTTLLVDSHGRPLRSTDRGEAVDVARRPRGIPTRGKWS